MQKEAIWPIESAPITIPPRPYPYNPMGSRVTQLLALLPHSARDPGSIAGLGHCLRGVCTFSPCLCGFPPGAPVSSHTPKDVQLRCIGHAKLPLSVRGGLEMLNAWGYGDRVWVGLCSVQTRWAKWPLSALSGFYDSRCLMASADMMG